MGEDILQFHSERAMAELDMALRSDDSRVAQAHFGLSALHLDRMRSLKADEPAARVQND